MIASSLVLAGDLVSSMPTPLPPSMAVWAWVGLSMAGLALQWWLMNPTRKAPAAERRGS